MNTPTNANETLVGRKARFADSLSDGGVVNFTARIVKDTGNGCVLVEMPERVRKIPFPPIGGKRYGLFWVKDLYYDFNNNQRSTSLSDASRSSNNNSQTTK
jgi:hypothetical protein